VIEAGGRNGDAKISRSAESTRSVSRKDDCRIEHVVDFDHQNGGEDPRLRDRRSSGCMSLNPGYRRLKMVENNRWTRDLEADLSARPAFLAEQLGKPRTEQDFPPGIYRQSRAVPMINEAIYTHVTKGSAAVHRYRHCDEARHQPARWVRFELADLLGWTPASQSWR